MVLATILGMLSYLGLFGEVARTLSHFVSLMACFLAVPLTASLQIVLANIESTRPIALLLSAGPPRRCPPQIL